MSTRMDLLLIRAGISYRQLDYWVRCGWLHPRQLGGSGNPRDFSVDEERVLLRMARLVNAGMKPEEAAGLARRTNVVDGTGYTHLGPGMVLKTTEVRP